MAPKRNAGKIVRLGPPQAMMKRTIQRAAGEDIFCHCALQKGLVHDGHGGTLVALRKVPESTQQKSNWKIRRKVSGSTCSTGVTILFLTGPQRANGGGGTLVRKRAERDCGRRRQQKRTPVA
jgi:hypothetical protein